MSYYSLTPVTEGVLAEGPAQEIQARTKLYLGLHSESFSTPSPSALQGIMDDCAGDRGSGGVIAEDRTGATNVGVRIISRAGDGGR